MNALHESYKWEPYCYHLASFPCPLICSYCYSLYSPTLSHLCSYMFCSCFPQLFLLYSYFVLHLLCSCFAPTLLLLCSFFAPTLLLFCSYIPSSVFFLCSYFAPALLLFCSHFAPALTFAFYFICSCFGSHGWLYMCVPSSIFALQFPSSFPYHCSLTWCSY